ncbi:MAG: hypothetical protein ACO3EP_10615 [Phycisphaerales bacterium]|jgi:hypothetical protein
MPGGSNAGVAVSAQYRYRSAAGVSGWMSAEQLREAAKRGDLAPTDQIQAAGRADWVEAASVKGLEFPGTETAEDAAIANGVSSGHHIKFATIKELLGSFLHTDVEIRTGREATSVRLAAVGIDHFETTHEESKQRLFVPYTRVRRIVAEETSQSAALNYRDAHRLVVVIDGDG